MRIGGCGQLFLLLLAAPAWAAPAAGPRPQPSHARHSLRGTLGAAGGVGRPAQGAVPPSQGVVVAGSLPAGTGLQAAYYAGAPRGAATVQRVEPQVEVIWLGSAPAPGLPGQGFSVRWTGYVRAPETGLYVLHTEWDDATDIRLADANVLAMEKYEPDYFLPRKPPIPVDVVQYYTAGTFYRIELVYKNIQGVSRAVLAWSRPSELGGATTLSQAFAAAKAHGPTVIPQQSLYPELPAPLPAPQATAAPRQAPVAARRVAARQPRPRPALPPPGAPPRQPAAFIGPQLPGAPQLPDFTTLHQGTAVALPNLYFTQSTADLLPASRPVLNALVRELQQRPALRLEIAGHTDDVGEATLNLRLSQQRAEVVRHYLMQQGIDSLRLTARGYGGTRPVANNRDPQQRPRNRRVEILVQ